MKVKLSGGMGALVVDEGHFVLRIHQHLAPKHFWRVRLDMITPFQRGANYAFLFLVYDHESQSKRYETCFIISL